MTYSENFHNELAELVADTRLLHLLQSTARASAADAAPPIGPSYNVMVPMHRVHGPPSYHAGTPKKGN